jgi:signal transduction histidine kinase
VTRDPSINRRFLVVAPVGRDGELICALLKSCGFAVESTPSIGESSRLDSGSLLGLILTDEALAGDGIECLQSLVQAQPPWSDLPVLLLTSGPAEPQYAAVASRARMEIPNLFLLDRPVRKELLLSAVQVASTSRIKQLEMRDAAERQIHSEETLRNTEKLAVAGRLAATMAHEVNNPLEALGNLLFLVENSSTIDEARPYARLATQELGRISEIVQQTLRFHRTPAKPELTNLADLARSALALFRGKIMERRIVEHFQATPTMAFCSAGEIRQALVNLIGNAIDAMPSGGNLYVRVATVRRNEMHLARLTVADSGTGIRNEIRPNLFTQFFTTKGSRGTGLGLWLTRDIVLRNGGRIRYHSCTRPPTGTTFAIYLPARPRLDLVHPDPAHRNQKRAAIGAT